MRIYPPGTRKGNRYCIIRGRVGGKDIEITTDTADPIAAQKFAEALELRLAQDGAEKPKTFAYALDAYIEYRNPSRDDLRRLDTLRKHLGTRLLQSLTPHDLVSLANVLHPSDSAATKNRNVITPARSILHYAAANKWCEYLRIKGFREPRPTTRALDAGSARALILAARADLRLLLLVLFKQGFRITDAVSIAWDRIDLERGVFRLYVRKTDEWKEFPIDAEVRVELGNIPEPLRMGRLFPWRDRWQVYDALAPLCARLGVRFTPHMARHSLGTWLNAQGEGLRTIMATLGHADHKSSLRYQSGDIKIVRAAQERLGKIGKFKSSA
jgi:integrase